MTATTFDDIITESAYIDKKLNGFTFRPSLAFGAEVVNLAYECLDLARKMKACLCACTDPGNYDACVTKTLGYARRNPERIRRLYNKLPWYLWFVKRTAFLAADEWEDLAEDLEFISTAEKRKAVSDLCKTLDKVAHVLPSWRDTDLFQ